MLIFIIKNNFMIKIIYIYICVGRGEAKNMDN